MKKRVLSILLALCMALSLLPTVVFAQETVGQAATEAELTAALADSANDVVKLTADITITTDVTVSRSVTLDLNDHVLTLTGESLFFTVSGQDTKVTLTDSAETKTARKFSINQDGAWVPDENGDKTVSGGVITGGKTGTDVYGTPAVNSGVRIQNHGTLTVTDVTVSAPVRNIRGTIAGSGTFNGTVINEDNLTGGIFNGTVANYKGRAQADSKISGGIFYGTVANGYNYYIEIGEASLDGRNGGEIVGGTFYGKVTNAFNNKISGGSFYGEVDNRDRSSYIFNWRGVLAGGTFYAGHPGTVADGCCTVTYDYGNLDGTYAIQIVQKGETAIRPDDPKINSLTFTSWCTSSYTVGAYDFSKAVAGNMTLYARWEEFVFGIIVTDKDGNEVYVTSENYTDVLGDGTVSYTMCSFNSSNIPSEYWDNSRLYVTDEAIQKLLAGEELPGVELGKLTLNGAKLQKIETFCVPGSMYHWYFPMELKGENQITYAGDGAALDWTRGTALVFSGDGSLTVDAPNASAVAFGDEGQYYQRGGAVTLKARDYGMNENPGSFTFQDGSLTIQAGDPANASSGVFRSAETFLRKSSITEKATFRMGNSANNPLQFHTPYEWESLFDQYHEAQATEVINYAPNYLSLFTSRTVTFDSNGGSAVDAQTVAYGGTITSAVPTKTGYTFAGWYLGGERFAPDTPVTADLALTAHWAVKADYTVAFDTRGGSAMAEKEHVKWTDPVLSGVADPQKDGYDFAGWKCGSTAVSETTTYADLAENDSVASITLTAQWEDNQPPTGAIQVDTNRWNSFLNKITFDLFFRNTQRVEITASDTSVEAVKIEYLLTDTEMTLHALAGEAFTEYTGPFFIDPDRKYIIYARLTDRGNNVSYISSDGMVLDATAPGIIGIEEGAIYCQAQTVTIDENYVDTVTVNGQKVTLDENRQFILAPAEGPQQITVTDQAKNSSSMTVTVHDGHTAAADDGNCATPVYCVYHSDVVVIAAKQHDFSGDWHRDDSHHWHICQNSGCTIADAPAAHSGSDDGDCTTAVVCACGYVLTEAQAGHTWGAWSSNGNGTHTRRCTADGCTKGVETESCSGGTATCHSKAICDACGSEYGEIDPDNHEKLRHFPAKAATTDAQGHIEYWYCVDCRRYYTDAAATKEVTGADILIAKLPSDQTTPQTGDSSSFILWAAALFISGGLAIGAAAIGNAGIRRSKRSKR